MCLRGVFRKLLSIIHNHRRVWPNGLGNFNCSSNPPMVIEVSLREKYSYSEFFWSVFSHVRTKYGPKNSEYGHFSRSICCAK